MACLLALVLAATVLTVPTGNKLANAARTSPAEAFWRTALPGSPMPEAIRELLHARADASVLNDAKLKDDDDPPPMSFKYDDYRAQKASPRNDAAAPTPEVLKHVLAGANQNAATDGHVAAAAASSSPTVFFLEDAVRVGGSLPFRSVQRAASAVGVGADASARKDQLLAPLRLLTVRAVRAVAEGPSFAVCRRRELRGPCDDEAVAYGCRAVVTTSSSGPARAYDVDMAGGDPVVVMRAAVVCHADTSRWDPEHVAFRLLGVKPGGAAVCYAVPDAHVFAAGGDYERPGSR